MSYDVLSLAGARFFCTNAACNCSHKARVTLAEDSESFAGLCRYQQVCLLSASSLAMAVPRCSPRVTQKDDMPGRGLAVRTVGFKRIQTLFSLFNDILRTGGPEVFRPIKRLVRHEGRTECNIKWSLSYWPEAGVTVSFH